MGDRLSKMRGDPLNGIVHWPDLRGNIPCRYLLYSWMLSTHWDGHIPFVEPMSSDSSPGIAGIRWFSWGLNMLVSGFAIPETGDGNEAIEQITSQHT